MCGLLDTATANFLQASLIQAAPTVQLQPEENFFELLQIFVPHAPHLSFALHIPNLLRTTALPPDHPDHPHDCLLSAISLWAYRLLSPGTQYPTQEHIYLARALATLPSALASAAPHHRVQAVQAELLLSLYFFHEARLLEGRYHASAAAAAALGCGLHRIDLESVDASHVGQSMSGKSGASFRVGAGLSLGSGLGFELGAGQLLVLPSPRDALELGERINVFWAVYALDRRWSVALGCPPAISDGDSGITISTLLPRRLEDYENMLVNEVLTTGELISAYIDGLADFFKLSLPSSEHLAGIVAAALFERATRLVGCQFNSGIPSTPDFLERVDALGAVILRFNAAFNSQDRGHEVYRGFLDSSSTDIGVAIPPVNSDEDAPSPEAEKGDTSKDKGKGKASAPTTPVESRTNPFPIAQTLGAPTGSHDHDANVQRARTMALTRSLGHAAIVQLYCALAQVQTQDEGKIGGDDEPQSHGGAHPDARARCLCAAREIVLILRSELLGGLTPRSSSESTSAGGMELGGMDFFIGIIWLSAARILSSEAERLAGLALQMHGAADVNLANADPGLYTTSREAGPQSEGQTRSLVQGARVDEIEARLDEIQTDLALLHAAMHALGRTCPLIGAFSTVCATAANRT
ncbi:hypothetical protein M0805_008652 [Coniferiporia weirii]|nr:hypothetical protein M0805_008652 [Coniferiporia weirii]